MKVDLKHGVIVVFMVQHADDWAPEDRERLMNSLEQEAITAFGDKIEAR